MGHESAKEDALLRAISELRAIADRLIDEQIARVNALPDEAGHAGNGAVADTPAVSALAEAAPRVSTVTHAKSPARLSSLGARPQAQPLVASAAKSAAEPAPAAASRGNGNGSVPLAAEAPRRTTFAMPEDDSKLRLDALAKHLDDRMRRSRDAADKQKTRAGR